MKVVILAAGVGSRLGKPLPKPLTVLANGQSIMQRQMEMLKRIVSEHDIIVVTGFKKDIVMEAFPNVLYVYNDEYDTTNTSKSLLRALPKTGDEDVMWLNGDVVCDPGVIERVAAFEGSCMAVNTNSVGDEEVKYRTNGDGSIVEVSKQVKDAEGEAVGVNKVCNAQKRLFITQLQACEAQDYFERGIEDAIREGCRFFPVDISDKMCIEVDFEDDLKTANATMTG